MKEYTPDWYEVDNYDRDKYTFAICDCYVVTRPKAKCILIDKSEFPTGIHNIKCSECGAEISMLIIHRERGDKPISLF